MGGGDEWGGWRTVAQYCAQRGSVRTREFLSPHESQHRRSASARSKCQALIGRFARARPWVMYAEGCGVELEVWPFLLLCHADGLVGGRGEGVEW